MLVDAGVPLGTISDLLGHVDLTVAREKLQAHHIVQSEGHVASERSVSTSSFRSSNAYSNTGDDRDTYDTEWALTRSNMNTDDRDAQSATDPQPRALTKLRHSPSPGQSPFPT
jgi:hypothetical protein